MRHLDNYDALPISTPIPFAHSMSASEILRMLQSLSYLGMVECLQENQHGCDRLLLREFFRACDHIAPGLPEPPASTWCSMLDSLTTVGRVTDSWSSC